MKEFEKLIEEFKKVKALGFVPCSRPNNRDGGIGNTFEDCLSIIENNKSEADFDGVELKTQKDFTSSYVSLFSKSPSYPRRANGYLKEKFGDYRDDKFPDIKKLYASIFGNRDSIIYEKYKMKLGIDRKDEVLRLEVKDLANNILDKEVFWTFEALKKSSKKLEKLLFVNAETKKFENIFHYNFSKGILYYDFSFEKFLKALEDGKIMFDLRMGAYNSGKNYGKPHDHGSGFRIKKDNFSEIYNKVFEI